MEPTGRGYGKIVSKDLTDDRLTDHMSLILPDDLNGLEISEFSNIWVSEAVIPYNFTTGKPCGNRIIFIFDGERVIAYLNVYEAYGEINSTFETIYSPELEEAYNKARPVSFGYTNEAFMMYDGKYKAILGEETKAVLSQQLFSPKSAELKKSSKLSSICYFDETAVSYRRELLNFSMEETKEQIKESWAVCLASMIDYHRKERHTPEAVREKAKEKGLIMSESDAALMRDLYDYYGLKMKISGDMMEPEEVYGEMIMYNPLHIVMKGNPVSNILKKEYRNIVIYGMAEKKTITTYYLSDPREKTSKIRLNVSKNTKNRSRPAVAYCPSNYYYNSWTWSLY